VEKGRRLKYIISRPPTAVTGMLLESKKMMIIIIVRKGVLIWTK